jgi:hypothetical protein
MIFHCSTFPPKQNDQRCIVRYFMIIWCAVFGMLSSAHALDLLLPPASKIASQSSEDLVVEYWQWALAGDSEKAKKNEKRPNCAASTSDKSIWFLAVFTQPQDGKVRVSCTIPEGKYLYLRVSVFMSTARESETKACNSKGTNIDNLKAINDLTVEIDGQKVENVADYRVKISKCFNPFVDRAQEIKTGRKTMTDQASATSDGYWLPLKPLAKGRHIVKIYGTAQFDKAVPPEKHDEEFEIIIE